MGAAVLCLRDHLDSTAYTTVPGRDIGTRSDHSLSRFLQYCRLPRWPKLLPQRHGKETLCGLWHSSLLSFPRRCLKFRISHPQDSWLRFPGGSGICHRLGQFAPPSCVYRHNPLPEPFPDRDFLLPAFQCPFFCCQFF